MSHLPPVSEVIDALKFAVLPSFAVAAVCGLVLPRLFGRRFAYTAVAVGIVGGMLAGNYFRDVFAFRSDPEAPLSTTTLSKQFVAALSYEQPKGSLEASAEPPVGPPPGRYWLPWMALIATVVGVISQVSGAPGLIRLALRLVTTTIAVDILVPRNLPQEASHVWFYMGIAIFGTWTILERLATEEAKTTATFATALVCLATAVLMLHAHSARLSDGATLLGSALLGTAIATRFSQAEVAGIAPAVAILIPGFLLTGWNDTFSEIPPKAFILPAVGPLMPLALLVVPSTSFGGWKRQLTMFVLIVAPAIIAIAMAAQAEPLNFEEGM